MTRAAEAAGGEALIRWPRPQQRANRAARVAKAAAVIATAARVRRAGEGGGRGHREGNQQESRYRLRTASSSSLSFDLRWISAYKHLQSVPCTAYLCFFLPPSGAHDMRGVYRTEDGGRTWDRILFVNRNTGAADVTFHRSNPRSRCASMWHFRCLLPLRA
jgi:hypothetical protein